MLEKINHYSLTKPATVYDEEAMTSLELAGRTAGKVNEVVDAYNQLEEETSARLLKQDNSIPTNVEKEVRRYIASGQFDDEIKTYLGTLPARLESLLGLITEGTSTMDAEILDARFDNNSNTWSSVGKHIRELFKALNTRLGVTIEPIVQNVTPATLTVGYINSSGVVITNTAYSHAVFDVQPHDTFFIYNKYGYDVADAVAVDGSGKIVRQYHTSANSDGFNNFEIPIVIPQNAVRLYVNGNTSYGVKIHKIAGYRTKTSDIENFVINNTEPYRTANFVCEPLSGIRHDSMVITDEGVLHPIASGSTNYWVTEYPVLAGETIRIFGIAGWGYRAWAVLNEYGFPVKIGKTHDLDEYTTEELKLTIPVGGTKLYVAGGNAVDSVANKIIAYNNITKPWSHLNWYCVGDSLTEVNDKATKRYHDYIADKTGIKVINKGISGVGYMRTNGGSPAFYNTVSTIPNNASVVTIFGSGNDLAHISTLGDIDDTGTSTICGCINTTIDNLYANLPTVQLGIVSPTPWMGSQTSMEAYCEKLEAICKKRGIPYLDLYRCSGLRPDDATFRNLVYSKDGGNGVHPNETGHKMIASQFYRFLDSLIGIY